MRLMCSSASNPPQHKHTASRRGVSEHRTFTDRGGVFGDERPPSPDSCRWACFVSQTPSLGVSSETDLGLSLEVERLRSGRLHLSEPNERPFFDRFFCETELTHRRTHSHERWERWGFAQQHLAFTQLTCVHDTAQFSQFFLVFPSEMSNGRVDWRPKCIITDPHAFECVTYREPEESQ